VENVNDNYSCAKGFLTQSDISKLGTGRGTLSEEQHNVLHSGMFSVLFSKNRLFAGDKNILTFLLK
jgi:hypothetical protein